MEWLNPAGVWAFLGFLPVIALYVLKRKARRTPVPSLLLWKKTEERTRQNRPFQRLRSQLLLWLQLAMVALLALALMRPVTAGGLKGESVFVFDLSASMQAVNEQGVSRMEEAKRQALDLLSGMRDGDAVTVLAAGTSFSPVVSRSTDHALAEHAIRSLEAGNGGADLSGALSLAAAMKRETFGMEIYVFTDSTVEIPQDAHLRAVGEGASNVSLMDMSLQPEENTAFVRLVSWGGDAQVEVECYADGALCDVRAVSLTDGESQGVLLTVPEGTRSAMARVSPGGALAVDDTRWAVAQSRRQYTALLVTEGNVFLEEALRLRPELNLVLASPQDVQAATGCDLYIYDGVLPQTLPETGAVWAVNPTEAVAGIMPGEAAQGDGTLRAATGEEAAAICEHLLLTDVAIRSFRPLSGGMPVLLSGGQPMLALSEEGGRRAAVLGFDLHDSNLPLKADFPVMVQNLLSWLLPDAAASVEAAGCGMPVSFVLDARSVSAWVETPDGRQSALEGNSFSDTDAPGVYRLVETLEDGQMREMAFALHIPPEESDTLTVPASIEGAQAQGTSGYREWTGWVLVALFAVMLLEWEVSRRGAGI